MMFRQKKLCGIINILYDNIFWWLNSSLSEQDKKKIDRRNNFYFILFILSLIGIVSVLISIGILIGYLIFKH